MKSILIVNQSSGYLMVDIANAFVNSGKYDRIVLMVGNPETLRGLDKNVCVEKICKYNRKSLRRRFFSWVYGTIQVLFRVLFKYRSYELFLVSNPPTISFITLFCKNLYSTLIYDVYPDGIVSGGFVTRRNLLFRIWAKVTKKFYQNAQYIYTITEGMADRISQYCDRERIEIIPVWYSADLNPIDKVKNTFILEHGLQDKFIIMYSGNIGKGHNVKLLVSIAERMKEDDDVRFVIIGDGWEKKMIQDSIIEKSLKNVLLLPFQPFDKLAYSLSAADIAYISVEGRASTVCVPSKTFNFIKLSKPLLCVAKTNSELAKLIQTYKNGRVFDPSDLDGIISFIKNLKDSVELREQYKVNVSVAKNVFSPNNAYQFIKR